MDTDSSHVRLSAIGIVAISLFLALFMRLWFLQGIDRQEFEAAFTQHEAARRSLGLYKRGVRDVARRNLDVVRQSYGLGRGALLDVIAEQRRYIEIENGYTEVLKHVYDAAVEIERAAAATSQ